MLHFVTSYMRQSKSRKQTLESAQYGLEISFKQKERALNSTEILKLKSMALNLRQKSSFIFNIKVFVLKVMFTI